MNQQMENSTLAWQKVMPNNTVRYYLAEITRDLFDLIVFCRWGTKGSKRGGCKTYVVETIDEAALIMDDIKKRRASRGYLLQS